MAYCHWTRVRRFLLEMEWPHVGPTTAQPNTEIGMMVSLGTGSQNVSPSIVDDAVSINPAAPGWVYAELEA
jgi:hypothetical protein